jgi:hypothetical protein
MFGQGTGLLSFSTSRTLRKCPCPITIGLPRARMRPSDREFGMRLHLGNLFHLAPWKRALAISGNVFRRPPAIFCRRAFQPNSQRNALTVSQYHPLRALAALGLTYGCAPFFAGAKLPSRKAPSHFSRPSASRAPSNIGQVFSQTPSSSHSFSRRQQVEGDGYSSGKNRHATPGLQHPQNTFKTRSVGRPRTAPVVPPAPELGKQRRDQLPRLIAQQLLLLLHHRSSTVHPPQS